MSTMPPTPDESLNTLSPRSSQCSKPTRVLACVFCQQRKVKCDRKFPCANCIKSRAQCVPAGLVQRQRRRRFPERALLERIRKYEDLLRHNNITFEPLHKEPASKKDPLLAESGYDSDDEHPQNVEADCSALSTGVRPKRSYEANDSSHDDVREIAVKKAWDQSAENDDFLLFGSQGTTADLSTLHPSPVQIFSLWQNYLNNVNPLLKVTHAPSLQGRIIEASSDLTSINPSLEALLFSIYCTSILSLIAEDRQTMYGSSKEDLLMRYRFGCRQALSNCEFLQSSDRECLTALYLYLVSVRPNTVPQSLSSMLEVAIRIAQRIGIHSEYALAKRTVSEAEMCRRLWWSLRLFDTRIGELANSRTVTLDPTWDCKVPLNVNDFDLHPEMKRPPAIQGKSTEAIFAVVHGEIGEFIRHTAFHLDLTNPVLKTISKHLSGGLAPEGQELIKLEEIVEDQYLKFCDQEKPIYFMTIWTARAYLAKCHLLEHHSRCSSPSLHRTDAQRDAATSHALRMLECDTKIMTSPLTKGFLWLTHFHFPFPAYVQILQDLRTRPINLQARQAWEVMSDNYKARIDSHSNDYSPFFHIFSKVVLRAWEACKAAFEQKGENMTPPSIVSSIRHRLAHNPRHARNTHAEEPHTSASTGVDEFPMLMPVEIADQGLPYNMGLQDDNSVEGSDTYSGIPGEVLLDADFNQLDWTSLGGQPGWGCY